MVVTAGPSQLRAVAVFNPTAPDIGFLQPILVGANNQTYLQLLSSPQRVSEFREIAWPDRDLAYLNPEPMLNLGGESLWGFSFPDEEPLVSFWSVFREQMLVRIDDQRLADRPLLKFDIVEALDLQDAKQDVFTQAYLSYCAMGRDAADRWKYRSILEPALSQLLPDLYTQARRRSLNDAAAGETADLPKLRARTAGGLTTLHVGATISTVQERRLREAYARLVEQFPQIFSAPVRFVEVPSQRRPEPSPVVPTGVRIVLVGRIRRNIAPHADWGRLGVEVVDEAGFHPALQYRRQPALTIILGAQTDWRDMVDVSARLGDRPAIIVALATSASPLTGDISFQTEVKLPTVTFFAPYATSAVVGRDPVETIRPIIDIAIEEWSKDSGLTFKAQHNMLVRELIVGDQSPLESACRLAARALKAGALPGGSAKVYIQTPDDRLDAREWESLLNRVFAMEVTAPPHIEGRRPALLLFVERQSSDDLGQQKGQTSTGIHRLFEMRGWKVRNELGASFEVEDDRRRFKVLIVAHQRDSPPENVSIRTPGLSQAPLLVIHTSARREQLLIGNRGQFFHAAMEDIALMKPGTEWVWTILRRQLTGAKSSQAALRLAAALIVEAVDRQRTEPSLPNIDWAEIRALLTGPDCERFLRFADPQTHKGRLVFNIRVRENSPTDRHQMFIDLYIGDSGPVVDATVSSQLPLG